jgi:hypothetical protein
MIFYILNHKIEQRPNQLYHVVAQLSMIFYHMFQMPLSSHNKIITMNPKQKILNLFSTYINNYSVHKFFKSAKPK